MLTTISTLEAHFEKLNAYLTVWENIGSLKAYEIKSRKEEELEDSFSLVTRKRMTDEENEA